jgi:TubC N-terminal docking domain
MMLMLLLTELARLEAHLSVASDGLHVQTPSGMLTDEVHQAMTEHKASLMRYASLPYVVADCVGILTGNRQEQDITFVAPERQEAWRYKIGVMSLCDGVERFYWPRMVLQARPEDLPDSGGIPS